MTPAPIGHNNPPSEGEVALDRDGWIAVARGMRDHWLVGFGSCGYHSHTEAWLDLIMECRYQAGTVNNNGRKMKLEPGQLVGATSWLASRWGWTPKEVRGFLDKLEEEGMITRQLPRETPLSSPHYEHTKPGAGKGRFANVLTVSKYSIYQLAHREKGQVERQVEGRFGAGSGRVEGHIYKDNKGTRGQGDNETSPDSPESVAAHGRALIPEIAGLNGATSLVVTDLARWLNPHSPDLEFARKQIGEAIRIYGDIAVRDGHAELKADIADGKLRAPNVKAFYGYCRVAKDRKGKSQSRPTKLSRY